ncbi:MAG: 3-deoxy-7-phosphoheptulonate synthase [Spirochaetaceae bacterium]|nr:MAG: 3-deoxy-7-phosphoheptulonate synthase [Spirochaetaceae bacterium]
MRTSDLHISSFTPLIAPADLKARVPVSAGSLQTVTGARTVIEAILKKRDTRMLAIVGPCSIHDRAAALDYAERLSRVRHEVEDAVFVVMRVYFEKPRTRLGWRGLILDPDMDGSYDIQTGLSRARSIMSEITAMGLPVGSEMLDPIVPQYIDDLVSWASIGARTTESQTHREMASGLSMPVGYKNGTDGSIETAVNALSSSLSPHSFIGIDQGGRTCVVSTTGNPAGHAILRGGRNGPNYHEEDVEEACERMVAAGIEPAVVIDCSHGNSRKDHTRQHKVLRSVVRQRLEGRREIAGFMLESNINPGFQEISTDPAHLQYGVSITDACIGWEETAELLRWVRQQLKTGMQL